MKISENIAEEWWIYTYENNLSFR